MLRIQKTIDHFIAQPMLPVVKPDDTVTTAASTMKEQRADCVVVLDGSKLVGIFTERDFLTRVAAPGRDPCETLVREVMTAKVDTLHSFDAISYAVNRMGTGKYRHVPIVDDGKVKAVLGVRDVMSFLMELLADVVGPESSAGEPLVTEWTDIGGG